MTKKSKVLLSAAMLIATIFVAVSPATAGNDGDGGGSKDRDHKNNGALVVYFTRHAEKQTTTVPVDGESAFVYTTSPDGMFLSEGGMSLLGDRLDEACGTDNCAEELNPLGELRAELLADYFQKRGVTRKLDAVYATHKVRTQQTVEPTADDAGLTVETFPAVAPDGQPASELNPEGTSASECPTIEAIFQAQDEGLDTILVAGHSGTLYDIMGEGGSGCDGLGLDISDQDRFPATAEGRVANFGDVWKVRIDRRGDARFVARVNLQPTELTVVERAG